MLILVDEHVPTALVQLFRDRGHEIVRVIDEFGTQTRDEVLWQWGHSHSAVAVSWDRDFHRIRRTVARERDRYFRLSRLSFAKVSHTQAAQRALQVMDLIDYEYAHVQEMSDRRMLITVSPEQVRIER
jgi:predicted nuclease of predicted toxin-antitoxin system